MTPATIASTGIRTNRQGRRMATAWTRLLVGAVAVLVPVGFALGGTHDARSAGTAAVRTALGSVSEGLLAQHHDDGTWPAYLLAAGTTVVDDSGREVATIPAGVGIDYERSLDGTRAVVTLSDRGAQAVFDSARTAG